jgi:hypothetical protein
MDLDISRDGIAVREHFAVREAAERFHPNPALHTRLFPSFLLGRFMAAKAIHRPAFRDSPPFCLTGGDKKNVWFAFVTDTVA